LLKKPFAAADTRTMREQLRLQIVVPVAALCLVGIAVAAFAFNGSPAPEPVVVPPPPVTPQTDPEPDVEKKTPLERKLAKNPVVVVVVYSPDAPVDALATQEARAGAEAAGVGFLAIDISKEKAAESLSDLYDAREAPALLVFQRGPKIATQIDGFADRETVAQAAVNALL
jgi:hypothetical protein